MQSSVLDNQSTRRHMERVLVVSPDESLLTTVKAAMASVQATGDAAHVPDHLMALGAIAQHGEPELIVMHAAALEDALDTAAGATRELAPHARMVLVAPAGSQIKTMEAAGFDDLLVEPINAAELTDAVAQHLHAGRLRLRMVGVDDAIASASSTESHPPQTGSPPPADQDLGDVDLVEALLEQTGSARDLALKIAQSKSGIAGLGWCKRQHDLPAGCASVRIEYNGSTFGLLHAPATFALEQLQAWAGWLGRWLALEARMDQLWDMALQDELTGAWNRRYFNRFLRTVLDRAANERFRVTLMVFDIDDFKTYNDRYGHAAGDDILRECARLMKSVVRDHDIVARIGGDEFAVIFWDSEGPRKPGSDHPSDVSLAARRFQRAICEHKFPKLLDEAPGNLTISGGLASFPWDGRTPDELLEQADKMALQSKRQGKNAVTFGPGAARVCNAGQNPDQP